MNAQLNNAMDLQAERFQIKGFIGSHTISPFLCFKKAAPRIKSNTAADDRVFDSRGVRQVYAQAPKAGLLPAEINGLEGL